MKSLVERCGDIWGSISESPAQIPTRVVIPVEHIDKGEKLTEAFQRNEHYFQIRINEMYLTYSRKWFSIYDPMVFVVSEFDYDENTEVVPFVVGPMMMEEFGQKIPEGMVFSNTRVAGLHPYIGGRLILSVMLCRVQRKNYAQKLLQLIENASRVLDFSTALSNYVKVSSIVLDGIEALLGLGDIESLVGLRKEFDPDAGDVLKPGYFALINSESELNPDKLWVRQDQLVYGKNLIDAKPFRDADYVLYSIVQTTERSDVAKLPFYPLWKRVLQDVTDKKLTEEKWQSAKVNMASLFQMMRLSPDLVKQQVYKLTQEYRLEMRRCYDETVGIQNLGDKEEEFTELDKIRKESLDILNM